MAHKVYNRLQLYSLIKQSRTTMSPIVSNLTIIADIFRTKVRQSSKRQKQDTYHESSQIDIEIARNARHELFEWNSCFADELKLKCVFVKNCQTKSFVGGVCLRYAVVCQGLIPLRVQRFLYCLCAEFCRLQAHMVPVRFTCLSFLYTLTYRR